MNAPYESGIAREAFPQRRGALEDSSRLLKKSSEKALVFARIA